MQSTKESEVLGRQLLCGSQVFILSPVNGWESGWFYCCFSLFICQKKKIIYTDIQYITKMLFKDYRDLNYE